MKISAKFFILLCSLIASITCLILERAVGIPWDFHPDSQTYATRSDSVLSVILSHPFQIFNNGHYVLAGILNSSVIVVTMVNMVIFSVTNVLIYENFLKYNISRSVKTSFILALVLLNPYRLHLSTTMLKDTFIIFFVAIVFQRGVSSYIASFFLLVWRLGGIVYLFFKVPRVIQYIILMASFLYLIINLENVVQSLTTINETNMNFRDFDNVPSFIEFGLLGTVIRAIVWPLLAISGGFILLSPAFQYIPLALSSLVMFYYNLKVNRSFSMDWRILLTFGLLAAIAPGFTTYYRYCFPVLVCLPFLLSPQRSKAQKNSFFASYLRSA